MTQELFQQYINRECTPGEKMEVEKWLQTCSKEELDELLLQVWNDKSNPVMPEAETRELWVRLLSATGGQVRRDNRLHSFISRKIAVAAAMLVLVLTTVWVFQKKEMPPAVAQSGKQQKIVNNKDTYWSYATNNETNQKNILLEDGTEVTLYPNSGLRYPVRFEKDRRDIFLEGKAMFSVAKDKQRPFTVYNKDIATTALGTKFLVNGQDKGSVVIELYEGKVAINSAGRGSAQWQEKILLPGDVFTYDAVERTVEVKQYKRATEQHGNILNGNADVNFTNTKLEKVFDVLEHKYRKEIIYNQQDITGMYFTGSIASSGSLEKVLEVIAQMNGLHISERNGKYYIQKN